MHASGHTILTWNGLEFDLDILAEECQDKALRKDLAKLALNHTDIFFAIFSETGSMVSLDAAAKGMGIPGKAYGLTGEDAPKLWRQSREMQEKVLSIVLKMSGSQWLFTMPSTRKVICNGILVVGVSNNGSLLRIPSQP